ncbi:MAG: hypothetical protein DRJ40_09915 [Thermoprotei archaeon]|nr:MAG: hypothetical protein DRJ40_09915 [Thermoprotei archaeon]
MEFGVATMVYYPGSTPRRAILDSQSFGFRYLEISYEHFIKYIENNDLMRVKELQKSIVEVLETTQLKVLQVHAPYGKVNYYMVADDVGLRKYATTLMEMWIEFCREVDCRTLVTHTGWAPPRVTVPYHKHIEIMLRKNIEFYRELSKVAKDKGVEIAIENRLERVFGITPKDIAAIVSEVGSEVLGLCLDVGHAHINKLPIPEILQRYGSILKATHIHDNNGEVDQHLPPYMGSIDWKTIIKAFKNINYSRPLIFEVAGDRVEEICRNRLYLLSKIRDILAEET